MFGGMDINRALSGFISGLRLHLRLALNRPMPWPRPRSQELVRVMILAVGCNSAFGGPPSRNQFVPAPDVPFLQEIGRQVPTSIPLRAVAVFEGRVWVGSAEGLAELKNDRLEPVPGGGAAVNRLIPIPPYLWVLGNDGLSRLTAGRLEKISPLQVADVCRHGTNFLAACGSRLFQVQGNVMEPYSLKEAPFALSRVVSHQESLFVLGAGRLSIVESRQFGGGDVWGNRSDQTSDWGTLPSPVTRDIISSGRELLVGTDRGLGILRGMSLTQERGPDGLPYEDTLCLTPGFTNDVWIGTSRGAIRWVDHDFHYFAGRRWLPADHVNSVAVGGRFVYLATDGGLGIIEYEPYTLLKKARFYERHLEEWGQKRLGLVHKLEWDEPTHEFVREAGDNDGGYSGDYLAAESFRYAVTGEVDARRDATNTFHALRWLESMTGIPGFPARSIWVKGETGHKSSRGSGDYPAEWHDASGGQFEWKGDTSSDELCSHFHAVSIFLQLAARDGEAISGRQHLARIAAHLVDHHWQLVDLDGKPTRWGRWDPEYFLTDEGRFDRGLQCLELLTFMKTAAIETGDARFSAAYDSLVNLDYPKFTVRQRNAFPPEETVQFEDQLAFWSYWLILQHETEPNLRSLYRRSFERTYETLRVEEQPWYNFVYNVLTGVDVEREASLRHLREWPLDLRIWSYHNSHRTDLHTRPGYTVFKGGIRAISPREREPMRWDAWTMQLDGGSDGKDVVEPSCWLLAYWMGRYYGLIDAPPAGSPVDLKPSTAVTGARPYQGPPRPQ